MTRPNLKRRRLGRWSLGAATLVVGLAALAGAAAAQNNSHAASAPQRAAH